MRKPKRTGDNMKNTIAVYDEFPQAKAAADALVAVAFMQQKVSLIVNDGKKQPIRVTTNGKRQWQVEQ